MAPKANLTGFDPRKLAASAGQPANDPWARRYGLLTHMRNTLMENAELRV